MQSVFLRRCAAAFLATLLTLSASALLAAEAKEPEAHPAGHAAGTSHTPTDANKSKDQKATAVKPTPKGEHKGGAEHAGTEADKHK